MCVCDWGFGLFKSKTVLKKKSLLVEIIINYSFMNILKELTYGCSFPCSPRMLYKAVTRVSTYTVSWFVFIAFALLHSNQKSYLALS